VTKHEALVLTAFTYCLLAPFDEFHKYAEAVLGRKIYVHELDSLAIREELSSRVGGEAVKILESTWAKE